MNFETELHKAEGLGSAKNGLPHWIAQRITAVALIPLGVWFVSVFIILLTAPFTEAYTWLSSPWNVTLAIFFVLTAFYHGYLGMQVILEDYVPHEYTRWVLIIGTQLFSAGMALLAIVSILKVFLS